MPEWPKKLASVDCAEVRKCHQPPRWKPRHPHIFRRPQGGTMGRDRWMDLKEKASGPQGVAAPPWGGTGRCHALMPCAKTPETCIPVPGFDWPTFGDPRQRCRGNSKSSKQQILGRRTDGGGWRPSVRRGQFRPRLRLSAPKMRYSPPIA